MTNLGTYIGYKIGKFLGEGSLTGLTIRKMAGAETLDLKVEASSWLQAWSHALTAPLLRLNP
jgi:hypothetical protein